MAKRFWDTTCTFHFLGISEVMLTLYDFSVIIGLRLGGERIHINDSLTSIELKKLLGVVPSRMRSNNIPLSWLCENIPDVRLWQRVLAYSSFFLLGLSCVQI